MSLILVTNNGSGVNYTHDPMPATVISNSFRHEEGSATLIENEIVWTIEGILVPENGSIATQVAALEAYYVPNAELSSAQILDEATVLENMSAEKGIRIVSLSFPEGSGPEWATKRKFTLVLNGSEFTEDVNTIGEVTYTITYATDQSSIQTRTINGTLSDFVDKTATVKYATYKAAQGWATWSGANLIADTYAQDFNNTKCDFTIVHQKYWIAYGTGITNADVSEEISTDEQSVQRIRLTGWFEGSVANCEAAIQGLGQVNSILIRSSRIRDTYANRTSFSLEYINTVINDIIYQSEQITMSHQIYDFVFKRVLGGSNPVRQVTSRGTATAIQTGIIKRLTTWPLTPRPHWAPNYIKTFRENRINVEYRLALRGYLYTLEYAYEFEFVTDPGW